MANVFATNVQRQAFVQGVQDEIRAAIPMAQVSAVDTENLQNKHSRYDVNGDFGADETTDGTYAAHTFEYGVDTISPDIQAVYGERIPLKELVQAGAGANGGWDMVTDRKNKHVRALGTKVHRRAYRQTVVGAGQTLDNEVLAGNTSAGTPITVSTSNPDEIVTKVYELMQNSGLDSTEGKPYFMIDPRTARYFKLFNMGNGFSHADAQLAIGWNLVPFGEFDYYITPEVERQQVLTLSGHMAADNTISFKAAGTTITLTVKASPSAAGEVDLDGSSDETMLANIKNCINSGTGAGSAYIALSDANKALIKKAGIVATSNATTLTISSFNAISGAGTISNGTWGTEKKMLLAGIRNSTQLMLPSKGYALDELKEIPLFTGVELRSTQIYEAGVWTKDTPRIAKVSVAA